MSKKTENTGFICANCGRRVSPQTDGSYRNHCPFCLYSMHVDIAPGDRENDCCGKMEPIDIVYNAAKGYQIAHKCQRCGAVVRNRVVRDGDMPDDFTLILRLMERKAYEQ